LAAFAFHSSQSLSFGAESRETDDDRTRADTQWFFEAAKAADSLEVIEGLPHQTEEKELRASEAKNHKLISICDELFYDLVLPVSAEHIKLLNMNFGSQGLFTPPYEGPQFASGCGGFHADYGLRWIKGEKQLAAALICFGCNDILLVGKKEILVAHLTDRGKEVLSAILKPYRQLRPPRR
jgi:hypothetical protein